MWVVCESVPSWIGLSEAVLAGSHVGFVKGLAGAGRSSGLSVRLRWRESSELGEPALTRERLGVQPLSRRQVLQLVNSWGGPTLVKRSGCSNS